MASDCAHGFYRVLNAYPPGEKKRIVLKVSNRIHQGIRSAINCALPGKHRGSVRIATRGLRSGWLRSDGNFLQSGSSKCWCTCVNLNHCLAAAHHELSRL